MIEPKVGYAMLIALVIPEIVETNLDSILSVLANKPALRLLSRVLFLLGRFAWTKVFRLLDI